jgi:hypothetical protein
MSPRAQAGQSRVGAEVAKPLCICSGPILHTIASALLSAILEHQPGQRESRLVPLASAG